MTDNIHNLPNANKEQLALLKRLMPDIIEQCDDYCAMRYANYLAHIKAGFNEAQALALCNKFGFDK